MIPFRRIVTLGRTALTSTQRYRSRFGGQHPGRMVILLALAIPPIAVLADQSGVSSTSMLRAEGPRADTIARLFWVLLAIGTAVFVIMLTLFLIGSARHSDHDGRKGSPGGMGTVTVFGIVIPGIILIGVFGMTLWALTDLSKPASASEETIAIVGHQWWWEVNYNDRDFTTANEIHIPVGKPVQLTLTSNDVIHSFWVPQLSDKIDMIPGHTNTLWIQADRAGEYRGQCAEFCGAQHAQMAFVVIADSPDAYDGWIAQQQQAAPDPSNPQLEKGQQAFFSAACMYCHRIEGTSASGTVGPDLTHLGSRNYIGAGTLKNTPGNLAGWITNSQSIKPNNQMPNFYLAPDQLQAIIAYLESLK